MNIAFVQQTVHVKKTIIFISKRRNATQTTTENKTKTKQKSFIFINGEKKIDRFFLINFPFPLERVFTEIKYFVYYI